MNDPVLPIPDDVTTPWWNATKSSRLLLQLCEQCQHVQHYPRAICTHCASTDLGWIESTGQGRVDSFTTVHRAPNPVFEAPYVIARVQLSEGPTVLTRIVGADESNLKCDQPVELQWEQLADGHQLPVFRTITPL